ncbi:hypothetical protein GCM10027447_35170 [Glycomyces halotolerans]
MSRPPESDYTQAEAYAPMERAVGDTIASLPDFPGFTFRRWHELPCSHNGVDDPDYTSIEITYAFSEETSSEPMVRETYTDLLREHWTKLGYKIIWDDRTELDNGRVDRELQAERDDDIDLWYSVAGIVTLKVQSGCVPKSGPGEIEYIPPAGGVEPGGDGDAVDEYFPDGIPEAQRTSNVTDRSRTASPPDG